MLKTTLTCCKSHQKWQKVTLSANTVPGVAENHPFPILRALAYTTGLDYRPTCELYYNYILVDCIVIA